MVPSDDQASKLSTKVATKSSIPPISPIKRKGEDNGANRVTWTEKYKPMVPNDIIGNQSLVSIFLYVFFLSSKFSETKLARNRLSNFMIG